MWRNLTCRQRWGQIFQIPRTAWTSLSSSLLMKVCLSWLYFFLHSWPQDRNIQRWNIRFLIQHNHQLSTWATEGEVLEQGETWRDPTFPFHWSPSQIYHPNIDYEGNVCLNILREDWNPVLNLNSIMVGLQYLFLEPNANDPLNKGNK